MKIQKGCDNRCSYCVVPFMRGPSRSKPINAIKDEAKSLIDSGYKEIVLTGVNLGSFGKDFDKRLDLVDCIDSLEKLDVLFEDKNDSIWSGYSPNYIRVGLKSRLPLRNTIKNVQLKRIEGDRVLSCENSN